MAYGPGKKRESRDCLFGQFPGKHAIAAELAKSAEEEKASQRRLSVGYLITLAPAVGAEGGITYSRDTFRI